LHNGDSVVLHICGICHKRPYLFDLLQKSMYSR